MLRKAVNCPRQRYMLNEAPVRFEDAEAACARIVDYQAIASVVEGHSGRVLILVRPEAQTTGLPAELPRGEGMCVKSAGALIEADQGAGGRDAEDGDRLQRRRGFPEETPRAVRFPARALSIDGRCERCDEQRGSEQMGRIREVGGHAGPLVRVPMLPVAYNRKLTTQ